MSAPHEPNPQAKQIVVVSGKGGSGKTFLSSALAAVMERTVYADCDVDAANLHLMLHPENVTCEPFVSGATAVVDPERCTRCRACEHACRFHAIHVPVPVPGASVTSPAVVDPVACEGCGVCELVCPANAITLEPAERGRWCSGTTSAGPLVHAHLDPGEENSGKLVDRVRRKAAATAAASGADWILIDGPPGTGCATRSAMTGTDYVVIVAEPGVSGVHDMLRVAELAGHFRIPTGLVINKETVSPEQSSRLRDIAADQGMRILGEIPFSRSIPEALTNLVPYPLWADDEITAAVRDIRARMQRELTPVSEPAG
mgnify:CR=1 FL=1